MRVIFGSCVEVRPCAVHRDFSQQASLGKAFQRIIDGGKRHRGTGILGSIKKALGSDMPVRTIAHKQLSKRTPLTHAHFTEFEKCYGKKSDGTSKRTEKTAEGSGEESRFRKYSRAQITERGDNLDISWLKDEDASSAADLPEPDEIAAMIRSRLGEALAEMDALSALLDGGKR